MFEACEHWNTPLVVVIGQAPFGVFRRALCGDVGLKSTGCSAPTSFVDADQAHLADWTQIERTLNSKAHQLNSQAVRRVEQQDEYGGEVHGADLATLRRLAAEHRVAVDAPEGFDGGADWRDARTGRRADAAVTASVEEIVLRRRCRKPTTTDRRL
ncbi:hypothetical protein [Lentzea cavernae]|uniref:Uncharacterized protein n=1 Tax=Lentzea cavernae TaxID=2020703 RepID=A0ABQ3MEA8_9PSEU|nr:hypothetical protein [Lentzea cavernae]GHH39433.1 hypothetical protein GCM10017774_31060 [Lentzea cavernae]